MAKSRGSVPKRVEPRGVILKQGFRFPLDAKDRAIVKAAKAAARGVHNDDLESLRGLKCGFCGSRKTVTEFYRPFGSAVPALGVTGCDNCGAC